MCMVMCIVIAYFGRDVSFAVRCAARPSLLCCFQYYYRSEKCFGTQGMTSSCVALLLESAWCLKLLYADSRAYGRNYGLNNLFFFRHGGNKI